MFAKQGERVLTVGSTGSGKTAFNCWYLDRLDHVPFIIYDTKEDDKFLLLKNSALVNDAKELYEKIKDPVVDFIVYRPPVEIQSDPEELDNLLKQHYLDFKGIGAYIDEMYHFHSAAGRAGSGMTGLLTRGRSKGITTLMSTQRPAWLTRFALTEAQKVMVFKLSHREDRKKMADMIPNFDKSPIIPNYYFWHYNVGDDIPQLMSPIPLDKGMDVGYTDNVPAADTAAVTRFHWLGRKETL